MTHRVRLTTHVEAMRSGCTGHVGPAASDAADVSWSGGGVAVLLTCHPPTTYVLLCVLCVGRLYLTSASCAWTAKSLRLLARYPPSASACCARFCPTSPHHVPPDRVPASTPKSASGLLAGSA